MSGLVTVIVPAFNATKFLERAVQSVLDQSYAHWELIIVNDGSTDATGQLADRLAKQDERIAVVHQENCGLSGARNAGLHIAQGCYIQLLDADDLLLSHKLQEQVGFLESHPDCAMVYGEGRYFEGGREVSVEYPPARRGVLRELLIRNYILVNAGLFRRTVIEEIGYFKETSKSRYPLYGCEDWDYWLRMAVAGLDIIEKPGVVVHNHWHGDNMSSSDVDMRRSHLWVLLEAAQNSQELKWSQRTLLSSQIVYRHFLYLKTLARLHQKDVLAAERSLPAPHDGPLLQTIPYLLAKLSPMDEYPQWGGKLAYWVGKISERIL
jgi:glycosyltransferase involved in cell wall biosynthesis